MGYSIHSNTYHARIKMNFYGDEKAGDFIQIIGVWMGQGKWFCINYNPCSGIPRPMGFNNASKFHSISTYEMYLNLIIFKNYQGKWPPLKNIFKIIFTGKKLQKKHYKLVVANVLLRHYLFGPHREERVQQTKPHNTSDDGKQVQRSLIF